MIVNRIKEILLQNITSEIELEKLLLNIAIYKRNAVSSNNSDGAKEMWIYEQITAIQKQYLHVFSLLKSKSYYDAWCLLERIEIDILSLKRHYWNSTDEYRLNFIEKAVYNLQAIYPYRLFLVPLFLKRKNNVIFVKRL